MNAVFKTGFYEEQRRKRCVIEASGTFLCKRLPDSYDDMSDEELSDFCEVNAWEPFEYWDGIKLFKEIESTASSMQAFISKQMGDQVWAK